MKPFHSIILGADSAGYALKEQIKAKLIADGYTGTFSAEHFGAADQQEYMRRSADNIKGWIK